MAQASSSWQQFIHWIERNPWGLSVEQLQRQLPLKSLKGTGGWFAGAIAYTLLLEWNSEFILSLTAGVLTLEAVAFMQRKHWQPLTRWLRLWTSMDQALLLALGSSAVAMVGTYLTVSLWTATENHWLAAALIAQGLLTCTVLGILLLQVLRQRHPNESSSLDALLADLTHTDPLKRLIAVRKLPSAASAQLDQRYAALPQTLMRSRSGSFGVSHLVDCLHIMLNHETDPIVRSAVLDTLQVLNPVNPAKQLGQGQAPFAPAMSMRQTAKVTPVQEEA